MNEALKQFMDHLAKIGEVHSELYDTSVREYLAGAMFNGFVRPREGWTVSSQPYGMFSDEGNDAVRAAVSAFLTAAVRLGAELSTEEARRKAVWNYDVRTTDGRRPDDFLGAI